MCEQHVWARCVSAVCVTTLCVTALCEHSMCEHSMCEHSICEHSMWGVYVTTKNRHQFLGRMLQNTEKYEIYQEKSTSVLKAAEHRKVRELPRKMHIEAVEPAKKPKKSTSFVVKTSFEEHPRTTKSTRITTKNEHRRKKLKNRKSTRTTTENRFERRNSEKYENYHEKEHRRSRRAGKLRKFTDKTRARPPPPPQNYENSQTKRTCKHETTKIATNSARSSHLAFYPYRKNPKCSPHCLGNWSRTPISWKNAAVLVFWILDIEISWNKIIAIWKSSIQRRMVGLSISRARCKKSTSFNLDKKCLLWLDGWGGTWCKRIMKEKTLGGCPFSADGFPSGAWNVSHYISLLYRLQMNKPNMCTDIAFSL